jgi:hypothetical protein
MDAERLEDADDAVVRWVVDVLSAEGPQSFERLAERLDRSEMIGHWRASDLDDAVDRLEDLLASYDGFWITADDRVAIVAALVDEIVLTHRLDAGELATGMVRTHPDLLVLDCDRTDPLERTGGGHIEHTFAEVDDDADEHGSLLGPAGWLDGFAEGTLVSFARREDHVTVTAAGPVGDGGRMGETLRRCFAARVRAPGYGASLMAIVLDALVADDDAFLDPLPPLTELLDAAGLEARGEWVGPADAEWQPPLLASAEGERAVLAERYQLDDCCLELLDGVMDAWNELVVSRRVDVQPWPQVAQALEHGFVAPAFADHVLPPGEDTEAMARYDTFVAALTTAGRRADAPAAFLSARGHERRADVLAAETSLRAALRADPHFAPALEELAWYLADRGDAEQAVNLLRRSGVPADDPELTLLESMRPARNAVGRNERCPCGSGRKYKDCCSGRTSLTTARRGEWLLHRLWTFVLRPDRQHHPLALAAMIAPDDVEVDRLLDLGVPMDLAAFEGGLATAYLVERGPLLTDEDRDLLRVWIDTPRVLWRVDAVSDASIVLRGVSTERTVTLSPDAMRDIVPGELVLARVTPSDQAARVVGVWIEVAPDEEAAVVQLTAGDPDDLALARWLGGRD